jgi:hypothetical protein
VLTVFQKSKTIEDFEKTLNEQKTGVNNLDLNLDKKVDFIKVTTKQDKEDFTFILQVDISEKETQDVAVILLSKDKDGKVSLQIVGDKELYGENYIVEPRPSTPSVTPNPAYTGSDPVPASAAQPASTTVVVVESAPVVQYVYSPAYVPYTPPYYYGFYPGYFFAFSVMAVGMYSHACWGYHGGYHGGYGGNVYIHNENHFNNYNNNSRRTSNTVSNNRNNGNYGRNTTGTRPSTSNRASGPSASARPSTSQSARPSAGTSASNRSSASPSARSSASPSSRSSASPSSRSSSSRSSYGSSSRSSYGSSGSRSSYGSRGGGSGGGGGRRR